MSANADKLISEIEAGTLSPMTHVVTRSLYRHIALRDDMQREIVKAFDDGLPQSTMAALQAGLWAKIKSLDVRSQGGLRLLVGLTRPNEIIDWYLAEFMILWAREQGLAEQQIIDACHVWPNGS